MKATFIKQLKKGFRGDARLYKLNPPFENNIKYVVVSATIPIYGGPETYIFEANREGKVRNWGELKGSFKGDLDHGRALRGMGYEVE